MGNDHPFGCSFRVHFKGGEGIVFVRDFIFFHDRMLPFKKVFKIKKEKFSGFLPAGVVVRVVIIHKKGGHTVKAHGAADIALFILGICRRQKNGFPAFLIGDLIADPANLIKIPQIHIDKAVQLEAVTRIFIELVHSNGQKKGFRDIIFFHGLFSP